MTESRCATNEGASRRARAGQLVKSKVRRWRRAGARRGGALGEFLGQLGVPVARLLGHRAMRGGPLLGGAAHVKTLVRFHPATPRRPSYAVAFVPAKSKSMVNIHKPSAGPPARRKLHKCDRPTYRSDRRNRTVSSRVRAVEWRTVMLTSVGHQFDPAKRGYHAVYRENQVNHCPGCGRTHWYVGRTLAECGFCATALPLVGKLPPDRRPRRSFDPFEPAPARPRRLDGVRLGRRVGARRSTSCCGRPLVHHAACARTRWSSRPPPDDRRARVAARPATGGAARGLTESISLAPAMNGTPRQASASIDARHSPDIAPCNAARARSRRRRWHRSRATPRSGS